MTITTQQNDSIHTYDYYYIQLINAAFWATQLQEWDAEDRTMELLADLRNRQPGILDQLHHRKAIHEKVEEREENDIPEWQDFSEDRCMWCCWV